MASHYVVWDALNGSEETAHRIEADDADEAATKYADEDVDGHADGLYSSAHPLAVRSPDDTLAIVMVVASYSVDHVAYEPSAADRERYLALAVKR